nr:uncharacterized protein LOC129395735 [Pan paniscus]
MLHHLEAMHTVIMVILIGMNIPLEDIEIIEVPEKLGIMLHHLEAMHTVIVVILVGMKLIPEDIEIVQVPEKPGIILHHLETMHTVIMVILVGMNIPLEDIVITMATVRPLVEIILNIYVEVLIEMHFRDTGPLMMHHPHEGLGCLMVEAPAMHIVIHEIDTAEVGRVTQGAVVIFIIVIVSMFAEKTKGIRLLWVGCSLILVKHMVAQVMWHL